MRDKMSKFRDLFVGIILAIVTSVIWLFYSCSSAITSSVHIEPSNVNTSKSVQELTTTPESTTWNNSTPIERQTTTASVFGINITDYRLAVTGLVSTPLSLSYESILKYPTILRL